MGRSGDGERNILGWPNHLKTKAQVEYPLNCFIEKAKMMLNLPVLALRLWRYFTVVFSLVFDAFAILTCLCVICRHFICLMSMLQDHTAC